MIAWPVAAKEPAVRCPRDGCALLGVERHRDWSLVRRRLVFTCGFDLWEPIPVRATLAPGQTVCRTCNAAFTPTAECRKVCARCAVCIRCGNGPRGRHVVADCPRRVPA